MIFFNPEKLSIRTLMYIGEDYNIERLNDDSDEEYACKVYKEIKKDLNAFMDILNSKNWKIKQ